MGVLLVPIPDVMGTFPFQQQDMIQIVDEKPTSIQIDFCISMLRYQGIWSNG